MELFHSSRRVNLKLNALKHTHRRRWPSHIIVLLLIELISTILLRMWHLGVHLWVHMHSHRWLWCYLSSLIYRYLLNYNRLNNRRLNYLRLWLWHLHVYAHWRMRLWLWHLHMHAHWRMMLQWFCWRVHELLRLWRLTWQRRWCWYYPIVVVVLTLLLIFIFVFLTQNTCTKHCTCSNTCNYACLIIGTWISLATTWMTAKMHARA